MTENEQKIFDLLVANGYIVKSVEYYNNWSWMPDKGWWAEDMDGNDHYLGKDIERAIENINLKKVWKHKN